MTKAQILIAIGIIQLLLVLAQYCHSREGGNPLKPLCSWIPALYVFSRPIVFATIPKLRLRLPPLFHQFYLVAASSQLSYIGMGMAFPWLNTSPVFAGMTSLIGHFEYITYNCHNIFLLEPRTKTTSDYCNLHKIWIFL